MKILEVVYIDAASVGQLDGEEIEFFKPGECTSVGYLIRKTKDFIVLCMTVFPKMEGLPKDVPIYRAVLAIPRKNIIKTTELKK